jgi:hypothetical protein
MTGVNEEAFAEKLATAEQMDAARGDKQLRETFNKCASKSAAGVQKLGFLDMRPFVRD